MLNKFFNVFSFVGLTSADAAEPKVKQILKYLLILRLFHKNLLQKLYFFINSNRIEKKSI